MSILTYTHHSMFRNSGWCKLNVLRLWMSLELGCPDLLYALLRGFVLRVSDCQIILLLEQALRVDMCIGTPGQALNLCTDDICT